MSVWGERHLFRPAAISVALVVLLGVIAAPRGATSHALPASAGALPAASTLALFSDPSVQSNEVESFEQGLATEPGSDAQNLGWKIQVRASFYHFTDSQLAAAFVQAATDGVTVRVLLDGSNRTLGCGDQPQCTNPAFEQLKTLNIIGNGSWLKTCDGLGPAHPDAPVGTGNGCVGQTRNHNKFILVSKTARFWVNGNDQTPMYDVVFQTSLNSTHASYYHGLNNALVTMNQPEVYNDYKNYFRRLAASYAASKPPSKASIQRFASLYGHINDTTTLATHDVATWSFPQPAIAKDPIATILAGVRTTDKCANDDPDQPGGATLIALVMARINGRLGVIHQLIALKRSGCGIGIIYAEMGKTDRKLLTEVGVPIHRLCNADPRTPGRPILYAHSKYLLIAGSERGLGPDRRIVYTGSDNLDNQALTSTDDRIERYVEPAGHSPVFDAYAENFQNLIDLTKFGFQSSATCGAGD